MDSIAKALEGLKKLEGNPEINKNDYEVFKKYPTPESRHFRLTRKILWEIFLKFKPAHYKINKRNEKQVYTMLRYFIKDQNFNKQNIVSNTPDLQKGILIYGNYGVGKSQIFEIFKSMGKELAMNHGHFDLWFSSISAGSFVEKYMEESTSKESTFSLEKYYKGKLYIDDLGFEQKAFNKTEIFEKLLFERHRNNAKTFITTNLKPSEIIDRYGDRIGDRLGEMFNIISWEGESWRD